jgi:hypothetical protein
MDSEENKSVTVLDNAELLVEGKKVNTNSTLEEIYKIAKEDRDRAIEAYNSIKSQIDDSDKPSGVLYEALNGAQHLIQTSTDKLLSIAKMLNNKDNIKTLNQYNYNFDPSILEDERETFEEKTKKLGVKRK